MKIIKHKKKNYLLNKRKKKSQDYLQAKEKGKEREKKEKEKGKEKEKDTKSPCCLIKIYNYIYSHFLESRLVSPFALTILTLVNLLINLIIFVCSLICPSIVPRTPYYHELMNNWFSRPISGIVVKYDTNDITENYDWYKFKRWEGRNFQLNYLDTNYNLTLFNSLLIKREKNVG